MPEVLTETDSIKFSDYLAEQMRDPEFAAAYKEVSAAEDAKLAEIRRLEREVIEAAKAWNSTNHRDTLKCEEMLMRLGDAVDELEKFESSQLKK